MPTIREVAQKAGVSVTTVSHVVNQTRFVAHETQERVREAMTTLGYRPNTLARSLRRGETRTIGLILPDSANPFFAEAARLMEEAAFHQSYSLILCNSNGNLVKEKQYTDVLFNQQVDGIIFMASGDDPNSLQELISRNMPVVIVDRILDQMDVDAVITDNHLSGYLAARHLLENGHKRIGLIRGPSNVNPSAQRVIGFQETLSAAGIQLPPDLVFNGDFHPQSGYIGCKKFLSLETPPTAIFTCNDLMAIGTMRAIHEHGLSIPGDISVIGHDDIEWASYTHPSLTTIAQPIQQLADTAIRLLLDRIQDPNLPPRRYTLPNQIIVRQSTRRIS